jgi:anti-sigma-K factor RskA
MTDDPDAPSDPEMLAAEYALGMLDADAHAAAEARIAIDLDFAARVARWEAVGHDWASTAPADKDWSPDDLWHRLEATFPTGHEARVLPRPANDIGKQSDALGSAFGWRLGTIAASFAALVLGGLFLSERGRVQEFDARLAAVQAQGEVATSAIRVAQVSQADGAPLLSVIYEGQDGKLTARIAEIADQNLVPELWVIGPDGKPRSLGQGTGGSAFVVEITEQMRKDIAAGSVIAISLEEPAPVPSAQPTAERILGAAQLAPVT